MTLEDMKKEKKRQGFSNQMISELSGIPYGTVQKIFGGETSSPRYDTMQALQKFFDEFGGGFSVSDSSYVVDNSGADDLFRETSAYRVSYDNKESDIQVKDAKVNDQKKDNKTIEDYLALPEGTRVELIDGKFYDMAAPSTDHQDIALELASELKIHVRKNNGSCHPYISPIDVQLDCDDKTMVQPDVIIVCDKNKITKPRIVGAPDFIAEVLSPSNVFMDTMIKFRKYKNAGVREYWVISPENEKVIVFVFEKSDEPTEYSFDDDIPVGIWNGECTINFKKLLQYTS
jgi:Uncharacterized protein conserved in cyanobacteria